MSFLLSACSKTDGGKLLYVSSNPGYGFNFPYFLFIPEETPKKSKITLIVEPNNSPFLSDNISKHKAKAKRIASKDFYIGNYIARRLKFPLLVPVFPRPAENKYLYTHIFDRDTILQKSNLFERIDLQLLSMIDDARNRLSISGYDTENRIIMTGFSASGSFVNRFSLIHPERILAVAAGGLNGLLMLPIKDIDGKKLKFPLGTGDFHELFGFPFNSAAFAGLPQFLFMGENDTNDAVLFDDGYSPDERDMVLDYLGKEMLPERWNMCEKIYGQNNINAKIMIFSGTGHEHPEKIKNEILLFFIDCLQKNSR